MVDFGYNFVPNKHPWPVGLKQYFLIYHQNYKMLNQYVQMLRIKKNLIADFEEIGG